MGRTLSDIKAQKRYEAEKIERITLRVPKGKREIYEKIAKDQGKSLNKLINDLLEKEAETRSKSK